MAGDYSFPGIRTLGPGITARNLPTTAADASKQKGTLLPNRKPPVPPGAAESVENTTGIPTQANAFLVDQAKQKLVPTEGSRAVKQQLVNATAGIIDNRNDQFRRIESNFPKLDLEELQRERLERQEARPEQEKAKEAAKENAADAAKLYRRTQEDLQGPRREPAEAPARERERSPGRSEPASPSRRSDLAAAGATKDDKGDPQVNAVA